MNIVCIICSDGIIATSEIYTTGCGHVFHYACLIQWIERSKTCPQCRSRVTSKAIYRIYFNYANVDDSGEDKFTLQSRLENLQFELTLKNKDVRIFQEKCDKLKTQTILMREEIQELEKSIRTNDSIVHALKDQIGFFKNKAKERDAIAEELAKTKSKVKEYQVVEMALSGAKSEIDQIVRSVNDAETLSLIAGTLKKALVDSEKKRKNVEQRLKNAENDLCKCKREVSSLEMKNKELIKESDYIKTLYSRVKDNENITNNKNNSPSGRSPSVKLNTPTYVKEKASSIINSDSPYLQVKQNLGTVTCGAAVKFCKPKLHHKSSIYGVGSLTNLPLNDRTETSSVKGNRMLNTMSIFRKAKADLDSVKSGNNYDLVYNGLGGQSKEEKYPSPQTSGSMKRRTVEPVTTSKKVRKVTEFMT